MNLDIPEIMMLRSQSKVLGVDRGKESNGFTVSNACSLVFQNHFIGGRGIAAGGSSGRNNFPALITKLIEGVNKVFVLGCGDDIGPLIRIWRVALTGAEQLDGCHPDQGREKRDSDCN